MYSRQGAWKWGKAKKNAVMSLPLVLSMSTAGARVGFIFDYTSDANVGVALKSGGAFYLFHDSTLYSSILRYTMSYGAVRCRAIPCYAMSCHDTI